MAATPRVTVIIPARNEEVRIGAIVKTFVDMPEVLDVYVGIDRATVDYTHIRVKENGGQVVRTTVHGKGEVVYQTILAVSLIPGGLRERVILCDGDYEGLTSEHVRQVLTHRRGMTIGVPDWPEGDIPEHVTKSWPHVSGFRCLPWRMIPDSAHGYLLETQLNKRAVDWQIPVFHAFCNGLKSPFQWPLSERRNQARLADLDWGYKNGIVDRQHNINNRRHYNRPDNRQGNYTASPENDSAAQSPGDTPDA